MTAVPAREEPNRGVSAKKKSCVAGGAAGDSVPEMTGGRWTWDRGGGFEIDVLPCD